MADSITTGLDEFKDYLQELDKTNLKIHYVYYQLGTQKILLKIDLKEQAVIYDDAFGRKMNPLMVGLIQESLPGIQIVDVRKDERDIMAFSANQTIEPYDVKWKEHTEEKLDKYSLVKPNKAKEFAERQVVPLNIFDKRSLATPQQNAESKQDLGYKK